MLYVNSYLYPICCVFSILFVFSQLRDSIFFLRKIGGFNALSYIEKSNMINAQVYKK